MRENGTGFLFKTSFFSFLLSLWPMGMAETPPSQLEMVSKIGKLTFVILIVPRVADVEIR
jgi:hypothetical protein